MKFIEERDGVKMKEPGKTLALTEKYHQACIEVANKSGHRCHHFLQFFLVATYEDFKLLNEYVRLGNFKKYWVLA